MLSKKKNGREKGKKEGRQAGCVGAGEVARWVEAPATKPVKLNFIRGTHIVEEENAPVQADL